jgi:broad specificity phosphatase PhoE
VHTDFSRLTDKGIDQAKIAGNYVKNLMALRNLTFSKVYVSPLTRALTTLQLMMECCNDDGQALPVPKIVNDMREIDLYEWQGLLKEEVLSRFPSQYEKWRGEEPAEFQLVSGHNPVKELWTRAGRVWDEILNDMCSEGEGGDEFSVLMVGHNALNQALLCTFMGWDANNFRRYEVLPRLCCSCCK